MPPHAGGRFSLFALHCSCVFYTIAAGRVDRESTSAERGVATATKWFRKIHAAVADLTDFPLCGPRIPECAFEEHFTDFIGLRQLVVKPYRVVYEATESACNILGVMRACRLIGISNLGTV